jgi:alkylation response protein AidB-like acyl-CoA dehydrogenase
MFPELYRGPLEHPGLTHATMVSEEAAYLNYAFETTIATALSCAYPLYHYAQPEVRERFLPGILGGREIGATTVTEPDGGCDTSGTPTHEELDAARDEWVVNGFKRYISNASVADVYVVFGISNTDAPTNKGMSAVAVPAGTPGLSFPRRYAFMGRRGSVVGEVEFRDCRTSPAPTMPTRSRTGITSSRPWPSIPTRTARRCGRTLLPRTAPPWSTRRVPPGARRA